MIYKNINAVIDKNGEELRTDVLLHPGEVLNAELEARELKKIKFGMSIGIYQGHMSDLLSGKRNIGESVALRLEKELGISAEFWMRLQVEYNLAVLRKQQNTDGK